MNPNISAHELQSNFGFPLAAAPIRILAVSNAPRYSFNCRPVASPHGLYDGWLRGKRACVAALSPTKQANYDTPSALERPPTVVRDGETTGGLHSCFSDTLSSSSKRLRRLGLLMRFVWLSLVCFGFVVGCSRGPSRISAPAWDPEGFADAIVAKLDKNGDGSLDKSEFSAAPGLAWGAKPIDTDKNGSLSRDELVARFALYKKMRLGLTTSQMQLTHQGRPLVGAKVTLVPEFFLEGLVEPATGEVLQEGYFYPRVPNLSPSGLRVGYYRVVVESPRVKIAAKYTKAETTTLGVEVSPFSDDPSSSGIVQLVLRE